MGRRDYVDVVTALSLEVEHHLGKVFNTPSLSSSALTDIPVDAENAPQTAIGHEDGSRATYSTKGKLFSKMGMICRNLECRVSMTKTPLPLKTVGSTLSGTELAGLHDRPQLFPSPFQFPTMMEL